MVQIKQRRKKGSIGSYAVATDSHYYSKGMSDFLILWPISFLHISLTHLTQETSAHNVSQGKASVYIVSSSTHPCPQGHISNCHDLSFYTNNVSAYFTSGAQFNFMCGKHLLNSSVPIKISNISSIKLTGNITTVPKIHCSKGTFGFTFTNMSQVSISSVAFVNCGKTVYDSGLTVTDVKTVTLGNVSVKQTLGPGITLENVHLLNMSSCDFAANGRGITNCSLHWISYNVRIVASRNMEALSYNISNTTFKGNNYPLQLAGGLHIEITNVQLQNVLIGIKGCDFSGIKGCLSSGAYINICYQKEAIVEVAQSNFSCNEHKYAQGGALLVNTTQNETISDVLKYKNEFKLIINQTFFTNNIGNGVRISYHSISIPVTILMHNSHVSKNILNYSDAALLIMPENNIDSDQMNIIEIRNCTFKHNHGKAALYTWITWLGISSYCIIIDGCLFESNHGSFSGLGIAYINFATAEGSSGNMTALIYNCSFLKNIHASVYIEDENGAMALSNNGKTLSISMESCSFYDNQGLFAVTAIGFHAHLGNWYKSTSIKISKCQFDRNQGTILKVNFRNSFWESYSVPTVSLDNIRVSSSVTIHRHMVNFNCINQLIIVKLANMSICNNTATALSSQNCALNFSGYNVIANNTTPYGGGGLVVNGTGYAFTAPYAKLIFQNNKASVGGALYSFPFHSSEFIPLACTFLSLEGIIFISNSAKITGHKMYGGVLTNCMMSSQNHFITAHNTGDCKNITKPFKDQSHYSVSSDPFGVFPCSVTDNGTDIHYDIVTKNVTVYPGGTLKLQLTTVGSCNGFSPGTLSITAKRGISVELPDIHGNKIDNGCKEVQYVVKQVPGSYNKLNSSIDIGIAHSYSNFIQRIELKVNITFLKCPFGMYIGKTGACICDKVIEGSIKTIQCNISWVPNPFMRLSRSNTWVAYSNEQNCTVIVIACPFDYCSTNANVQFNLENNTDHQCANNRTGILCGQCQPGLSLMLGSNACSKCTNIYLLLIPVFITFGALLLVFLAVFNITISVGSINGLLFYANIVKLNEAVLFPNGSIPVISQFISWLNLDFGIQLCFFDGLDGYWKTWLQFVFPIYVWLLTIVIIFIGQHSITFSRYLRSNIISVLATLILLSFTKILRNITSVFMVTGLHCGKYHQLVWSVDGNIEYLSLKHSILVTFAVFVGIFVVLFTSVISLSQWLHHCNSKARHRLSYLLFRLQPFIDAYTGPFNAKYHYWTGVLLWFRIIIAIIFTYTSGSVNYANNYIIVIFEITVIWSILNSDFYQLQLNYLCEKFFHINLCVLCSVNSALSQSTHKQYAPVATIVSVSLSVIVFIAIVVKQLHHWYFTRGKVRVLKLAREAQPLLANKSRCMGSPSHNIYRRDSIIFDCDTS